MEKRIKIYIEINPYTLEEEVNAFLKIMNGKLHNIEFTAAHNPEGNEIITEYGILLVYTPEGEDSEKEDKITKKNEKSDARIQGKRIAFGKQNGATSKISISSCCNWTR